MENAINNIQTAVQDVAGGAKLIIQCTQYTIQFPSIAGLVARVTCLSQVCTIHFLLVFIRKMLIIFNFFIHAIRKGIA